MVLEFVGWFQVSNTSDIVATSFLKLLFLQWIRSMLPKNADLSPWNSRPHPSWPSGLSIVKATLKRIRDVIVSSAGTLPKLYVSVSLPGDVLESSLAPQAGDVEWVRCQKCKQCKQGMNQNESGVLGIARSGAKIVVWVLRIADWAFNFQFFRRWMPPACIISAKFDETCTDSNEVCLIKHISFTLLFTPCPPRDLSR